MCYGTDVDKKLRIDGRIQKSVSSSSLSVTQGNQEGLNVYYSRVDTSVGPVVPGRNAK